MNENGHRSLDLTDLVEAAHVILPGLTFDLPLDVSLPMQARITRIGQKLQEDGVSDEEYGRLEDDLWRLADSLLENAVPRPEKAARELLTLPALFRLIAFLTSGYRSLQESSVPSASPTPTTEPSPTETSLSPAPS